MPILTTFTMKRKLEEITEVETYSTQRQSVFHMSVSKLKQPRPTRVDPGLRRWVLILNTLKNIETEFQSEGVTCHPPQDSNFISNTSLNDLTLDPLPDTNPYPQIVSKTDIVNPQTDIVTTPKYPKDIEMEEKEEKTVLDLLPCRLPSEYNQEPKSNSDSNNNIVPLSSSYSDISTSYDPLHDIDISMCDFDFSTFTNSVKMAPLSADDIIHTFPSPSFDSASNLFNSQCASFCKTDHFEDLDHIIQILVGM